MQTDAFCVMYHFVADAEHTPWPRLVSRRTGDFAAQLDTLCTRGEPLTLDRLRAFFHGEEALPPRGFLLTFDHATRDHLDNVLPALQSRGLQGIFLPYTQAIEEHRICPIDKQRFLEYAFEDYLDLLRCFAEHVRRQCPDLAPATVEPSGDNLIQARTYLSQFAFYSDGERFFRHLRDEVLAPSAFEGAIAALFEEVFGSEADFARAHYLSWDDLRALRDAGMEIGGHGHRHLAMSRTPADEQRADVRTCVGLLRERLGVPADLFAYPNGGYNADTLSALREAGVVLAFTTNLETGISPDRPLEMGRIDTTALPTECESPRSSRCVRCQTPNPPG